MIDGMYIAIFTINLELYVLLQQQRVCVATVKFEDANLMKKAIEVKTGICYINYTT